MDTNVFVAAINERDERHPRALELLDELRLGRHGPVVTSDFIVDEVVTVALARTGQHEKAVAAVDLIVPPAPHATWIALEPVGEETFFRALEAFRRSGRRELSFTDWTTVALVREGKADAVVSFDADFDGLVARVC